MGGGRLRDCEGAAFARQQGVAGADEVVVTAMAVARGSERVERP